MFGLRELLLLALLSLLLVALCRAAFPRNAASRRLLIAGAGLLFLLASRCLDEDWESNAARTAP